MHLKPTTGCQISTLIFDFFLLGEGTVCISHEILQKDDKVLCHLGFQSKIFPGHLTDFSA